MLVRSVALVTSVVSLLSTDTAASSTVYRMPPGSNRNRMTCPLSMAAIRARARSLTSCRAACCAALRMTGLRKEGQATASNMARIASTMINSNSENPRTRTWPLARLRHPGALFMACDPSMRYLLPLPPPPPPLPPPLDHHRHSVTATAAATAAGTTRGTGSLVSGLIFVGVRLPLLRQPRSLPARQLAISSSVSASPSGPNDQMSGKSRRLLVGGYSYS